MRTRSCAPEAANEHTGDHKGAERAYRRGIELAPDNVELSNAWAGRCSGW
jgi:hypothetical protein